MTLMYVAAPTASQELIFQEFNSLSIVYGMPEVEFVDDAHRFVNKAAAATAAAFGSAAPVGAFPTAPPASAVVPTAAVPSATATAGVMDDPFFAPAPAAPVVARGPAPEVDLLGLDDFGFGAPAAPVAAPAPVVAWSLNPAAVLEPAVFQAKWLSINVGCVLRWRCQLRSLGCTAGVAG